MMIDRIRLINIYGLSEDYFHVQVTLVPQLCKKSWPALDGIWNIVRLSSKMLRPPGTIHVVFQASHERQ